MGAGSVKNGYKRWRKEDDALLVRRCREQKMQKDIAVELGRSEASVSKRAQLLRNSGVDLINEPGECYMSPGEIAASYRQAKDKKRQITILAQLCCLSKKDVLLILAGEGALEKKENAPEKRAGNDRTGKRYTEQDDEAILRGYREKKTPAQIGRELGRNRDCIIARMHKLREAGLDRKK